MTTATLDDFFAIAEAGPLLDRAEAVLRASEHAALADEMTKLQQDCGVEIDRNVCGTNADNMPGALTAALHAQFTPVTAERLTDTLRRTALLAGPDLVEELTRLSFRVTQPVTGTPAGIRSLRP